MMKTTNALMLVCVFPFSQKSDEGKRNEEKRIKIFDTVAEEAKQGKNNFIASTHKLKGKYKKAQEMKET